MTQTHTEFNPEAAAMIDRIRAALDHAEGIRDEAEPDQPILTAKNMEAVREILDLPAKFYPAASFDVVPELNVIPIVESLYDACKELIGDARRVTVTWRVKHGTKAGDITMGTCGLVSGKQRDLAEAEGRPVYHWEVTLALDVWILLTPNQRERLMHHELMHCNVKVSDDDSGEVKPALRNHEIEEFGATAARYGLLPHQVRVAALAMSHTPTAQAVQRWQSGPDDAPLLGAWITN